MYETLADLVAAVREGKVTAPLRLDNDNASVYEGDEKVFEMHPAELLEQALDLLQVRWEGV